MSSVTSRPIDSSSRTPTKGNGAAGRSAAGPTPPPCTPADQVRRRAFELFEQRRKNGGNGDAISDWLAAEREVNANAKLAEAKAQARGETLLRNDD
jgi:hypothetical protein